MVYKPAIAVVFHHIGPYHHARLNAAADRLAVTGIEWSAKGYDSWGAADAPADAPVDEERPIVEVDPELERLLAEEEDIERRTRGEHHETPHFPKDA